MAASDFLDNVRTARNVLFLHTNPERANATRERLLATTPLWLTPAAVNGFDPADFDFLPPERRSELARGVTAFRQLATAATGRDLTEGELADALEAFNRIVSPLKEALSDPEGLAILGALLWSGEPLPPFVLGFDYTLGADATGDPAVWVRVILSDDLDPEADKQFAEFAREFPRHVTQALQTVASPRLAYIRYRPLSEARRLLQGTAA